MSNSTAARRMGTVMVEMLIADLKSSGYLAMFTNGKRKFKLVAQGSELWIDCWVDSQDYTRLEIVVKETVSGRFEIITNQFKNNAEGKVRMVENVKAQWTQDMIWVANKLAVMLDKLYTGFTITGEQRVNTVAPTGHSILEREVAQGFERLSNNASLGGRGND